MLIHYVGDIHQPLHSATEVDHTFPESDAGGCLQDVPERETVNNLHSIWDSVIYSYIGYETLPLTDERWSWITETVDKLHFDHPVDIDKEEFKHYCLPLP